MARIAICVFDGVEELDFVGPWEVFAAWASQWPQDGVEVFTVAPSTSPLRCAKGLQVIPDGDWSAARGVDLLVYPGGHGTRRDLQDEQVLAWLRNHHAERTTIASVCTGALVLAAAGLLDGRPATTHWMFLDRLAELGRGIEVRTDERFVDDGDILTAAGVSAGIDLALHLVGRMQGPERAAEVRRYIQY